MAQRFYGEKSYKISAENVDGLVTFCIATTHTYNVRRNMPKRLEAIPEKIMHRAIIFNDVDEDLLSQSHDIGFGWTLRKATPEELQNHQFRFNSESWAKRRGWNHGFPPQLQVWEEIQDEIPDHIYNRPPESEEELLKIARVMVLEANDTSDINEFTLQNALAICDAELRIGISFNTNGSISTRHPTFPNFQVQNSLYTGFNNYKRPSLICIQDIKDTVELFSKQIPVNFINSISLFRSLDYLPDYTPMKILGYFTVMESILTHKPDPNDPTDSISRQLKHNLKFVNGRLNSCGRSLGFEDFEGTTVDTMINKLYSYRSAIAHGNSTEEFTNAILKKRTTEPSTYDDLWVHDWMRRIIRRILFEAIREPEIITNLTRRNTTPNNLYKKCVNWFKNLKSLFLKDNK